MLKREATIIVDQLNLRMTPNGEVVGAVKRGDRFTVFKRESRPVCDWLQIRIRGGGGLLGWIAEVNKRSGERFARVEDTTEPQSSVLGITLATILAFAALVAAAIWASGL